VHIRRGCLLHDIGKMGVPDGILLKPGRLTPHEWQIMEQHPKLAYDMLQPITYLQPALNIPLYHHERWDGSGYPQGLKGEEIPLAARLFAVVDVWDAVLADRPYHQAWPRERALEMIQSEAGHHFDPQVVTAFLQLIMEDENKGVN
jgi:HD-GYP domain-containing protein (c-di-GMP phosphodiesterase class II)